MLSAFFNVKSMKINIIYSSRSGNTEIVCEKVHYELEDLNFGNNLIKVERAKREDLEDCDFLILAAPTYGHGQLEILMESFLKMNQDIDFKEKKVPVIGMGDARFDDDYHIESARILMRFVTTHNGKLAGVPLAITRTPMPHLEGVVKNWCGKLGGVIRNP